MTADALEVAVCVCTYRRPEGLDRLLRALAELEPVPDARLRVVVADNDCSAATEAQVAAAQSGLPWPLVYAPAPERGIAHARNAALDAAGPVDAVAFLDDDEWPASGWLRELVGTWRSSGADVVTGPVLPVFEVPPPAWVVAGRFFERDRFATGTELHYARTSNVLISATVLATGLRFEQTASGGGEDTLFFERARAAGRRVVWADEGPVHELVPASRVRVRWLVARSYRYGLTRSDVLRRTGASPLRRARRVANGVLTTASGVLLLVDAVVRGRAGLVAALQRASLGAGLVLGAFGAGVDDYRTVDGA